MAPLKRRGAPKSRAGCITCKSRRFKCDETKPHCLKCLQTGWECEGYTKSRPSKSKPFILPKLLAADTTGISNTVVAHGLLDPIPAPPNHFFQSEEEHRYYHVFYTETANELSGVFPPDLWGHLILQACHREDFIKHAVIAIAALYMIVRHSSSGHHNSLEVSYLVRKQCETHHRFALRQYGKSLRLMRFAALKHTENSIRSSLLACLLIVCFENYYGGHDNAVKQVQIGVALFQKWVKNEEKCGRRCQPGTSPRPEEMEESIIDAFSRMSNLFGASTDQNTRGALLQPTDHELKAIYEMPTRFRTLSQARHYFELYCRIWVIPHRGIRSRFRGVPGSPDQLSTVVEHEITSNLSPRREQAPMQYETKQVSLLKWFKAFQPLLEYAHSSAGHATFPPATMLLFKYTSLEFIDASKLNFDEETGYDSYLDSMKSCISLLQQVLDHEDGQRNSRAPRTARFAFELNYLPVLFLIAVKCRDFKTRRQSIKLLEMYPIREGFWDSGRLVAIARSCMEIEEAGLSYDEFVPDEKRLRILGLETQFSERKTILKYIVPRVGNEEIRVISWPGITVSPSGGD